MALSVRVSCGPKNAIDWSQLEESENLGACGMSLSAVGSEANLSVAPLTGLI